jgi:D-beta-D-heptose 7-phosphate kinase / D-beta-D-heptose 1-phosphate adenosyltransferase
MFRDLNKVLEVVQAGFQGRRVLVIGDLMLDRYLWGQVERISPEAPVPVVRLNHETHTVGGAANVAANLSGLGCRAHVVGIVGADKEGLQLVELLQSSNIGTAGVISTPDRPTTCKTRILGGRQQMLRFDVEKAGELSPELKKLMLSAVEAQIPDSAAIVVSDYGKGLLDDSVCQAIVRRGRDLSIPTFIDPKGLNYHKYAGCDVLSPNRMELAAVTSADHGDLNLLLQKGQQLRSDLGIDYVVGTLGELGIALLESDGIHRFPALAREVFDVSGAGDTVIATIGAAVAAGLHLHDAIRLGNLAAGIVIGKLGTVPVSQNELMAALTSREETREGRKVCSLETLLKRVTHWRAAGQRIVLTNGCFDLLHPGHLALLQHAKGEGDRLVVALNTDRYIRVLKGPGRPLISQDSRAKLVAALPFVDAVVLFDEETPLNLIGAVQPSVLVKGGNYSESEVIGAKEMKTWGGKVTIIPFVEGSSTSAILNKAMNSIREASCDLVQ